jgi:hypothetical protein
MLRGFFKAVFKADPGGQNPTNPAPDPLVRGTDAAPDASIVKQKY